MGWEGIGPYCGNAFGPLYECARTENWKPRSILGEGGNLLRLTGMMYNYHNKVRPAINAGRNILFDYFVFGLLPHSIDSLEPILRYLEIYPYREDEKHIYLKIDVDTAIVRHAHRYNLKIDDNLIESKKRAIDWYNAVAEAGYLISVDGTLPPEDVTEGILKCL